MMSLEQAAHYLDERLPLGVTFVVRAAIGRRNSVRPRIVAVGEVEIEGFVNGPLQHCGTYYTSSLEDFEDAARAALDEALSWKERDRALLGTMEGGTDARA